ncbi:VOC family protein [Bacillus sp. FJAT-49732]|uniref:VOC family protein n=1 Tax=Lederbergia citrisecunda TaxID=2833583 RepID=A0A942TQ36_9BACI|nr:VOC family protein [Lederbergia citrisecunda]MBS4199844.1 VOC family protein [Lederbergia citrisecunda]
MESRISTEIVQIYLPVADIRRSVHWYVYTLGYQVIWEDAESANLKLSAGPLLFLKKTSTNQPIRFTSNNENYPVLSFKTSDIEALHKELLSKNIPVGGIVKYGDGKNGPYKEFILCDPDGHQLEINSYPDLALPKFRGY